MKKSERIELRKRLRDLAAQATSAEPDAIAAASAAMASVPEGIDRLNQANAYQVGYLRGRLAHIADMLTIAIKHDLTTASEREKEPQA